MQWRWKISRIILFAKSGPMRFFSNLELENMTWWKEIFIKCCSTRSCEWLFFLFGISCFAESMNEKAWKKLNQMYRAAGRLCWEIKLHFFVSREIFQATLVCVVAFWFETMTFRLWCRNLRCVVMTWFKKYFINNLRCLFHHLSIYTEYFYGFYSNAQRASPQSLQVCPTLEISNCFKRPYSTYFIAKLKIKITFALLLKRLFGL